MSSFFFCQRRLSSIVREVCDSLCCLKAEPNRLAPPRKAMKLPTTEDFERLPWSIRALMGCEAALIAQVVNFWFLPLRAVPIALAFPAVILCAWFLEMWGAAVCAFTSIFVVDFYLSETHVQYT